eukprot:1136394-Pelagomonas_calceolata.AAC.10
MSPCCSCLGFLSSGFEPAYSVGMLGRCSFQSGKKVGIRAESIFNKTDVPVLGRDLSRINVSGSAWDGAHKDSVRAALVPGSGASTSRENPVRDSLRDVFRDLYALLEESLISAGIHTKKG